MNIRYIRKVTLKSDGSTLWLNDESVHKFTNLQFINLLKKIGRS